MDTDRTTSDLRTAEANKVPDGSEHDHASVNHPSHSGHRPLTRAEISRLNGARSRGPVTAEGKQRSSMNAVKHGLTAKTDLGRTSAWRDVNPEARPENQTLLHNEARELFTQVKETCIRAFAPSDPWEWELVSEIIQCRIQLRRHYIATARLLDRGMYDDAELFALEQDTCNATESERLSAALEHRPGLLHATGLLSRQTGQTLRQQRWLIKELREYRKDKQNRGDDDGPGGNDCTPALTKPGETRRPSTRNSTSAPGNEFPAAQLHCSPISARHIPRSRRSARFRNYENKPTEIGVAVAQNTAEAVDTARVSADGPAVTTPTVLIENEPSADRTVKSVDDAPSQPKVRTASAGHSSNCTDNRNHDWTVRPSEEVMNTRLSCTAPSGVPLEPNGGKLTVDSDPELEQMLVDNCAMQLMLNPPRFDLLMMENMFGDILSDEGAVLAGSIGMLPSASIDGKKPPGAFVALYEPVHGSAPDIARQNKASSKTTQVTMYRTDAGIQAL